MGEQGEGEASRARASRAPTVPGMGRYWDEPGFDPQLLPSPVLVGKV